MATKKSAALAAAKLSIKETDEAGGLAPAAVETSRKPAKAARKTAPAALASASVDDTATP